jgi:predicted esterase
MSPIEEHHLAVARTARYYTRGPAGATERWIVLHGYGKLAGRFLRAFAGLDDGSRQLVAPEGLSRFYTARAPETRVGASWMTREDRLHEIADYVRYLDALHAALAAAPAPARLVVLGFSQGVATACRWVAAGGVPATDLILWGELPPPDLDLEAAAPVLRGLRLRLVIGRSDEFVTDDRRQVAEARLRHAGLTFTTRLFDGGHVIDGAVLAEVAREVASPLPLSPFP